MQRDRNRTLALLAPLFALSLAACDGGEDATDDGGGGGGGKADCVEGEDCQDPETFACRNAFIDESGREDGESALSRLASLGDPFAVNVLQVSPTDDNGKELGCPIAFDDVMDRLRITDAEGCKNTSDDPLRSGITSAIVSEDGQLKDDGGDFLVSSPGYRVVVERACQGREDHGLFFSLFGASPGGGVPQAAEVIGFDESKGVFNYYVNSQQGWTFQGSSLDILEGTNRCGNCHNAGAPIMKELDSPWVHWEHNRGSEIQGAHNYIKDNPNLGKEANSESSTILDGSSLEGDVKAATRVWNSGTRFAYSMGTRDGEADAEAPNARLLLEPLFCSVEINLQSGGQGPQSSIRDEFFLDKSLKGGLGLGFSAGSVSIPRDTYEMALAASDFDQQVGVNGKEVVRDTFFGFTFPERSFVDMNWLEKLEQEGVIDEGLIRDVLMVDFTRPVFSDARCALLTEALNADAFSGIGSSKEATADNIRQALIDGLGSSSAPGASELVEALSNDDDKDAQNAQVQAYSDACTARAEMEPAEFVDDVLTVLSGKRVAARAKKGPVPRGPTHVIEFEATMANDRRQAEGASFDESCQLQ